MHSHLSRLLTIACLLFFGVITGCTSINSGLQAGDLPPNGAFVAENGITFNVQPLTVATLPPKQAQTIDKELYDLVKASAPVSYRIEAGDILSIALTDYPNISASTSSLTVDQQGFIQFPLIGRIKASGMSVPQFTAILQRKLQRYLKYSDPQVKVINYLGSKFFIDGEVAKSGEFPIANAPVSLYGALSMAGGATAIGDSNNIVLNRRGKNYNLGLQSLRQMGLSPNQIYIQDGDSIHVNSQDRNKVYVLGEFGRIAPVAIPEQGLSLSHVLGESSGLNPNTANAAKVYIVRDNPYYQYTNIYYVDMQTITSLALANRFEMQANDILYVDPTGLTRWNRILSSILPSTSAVTSLSGL
ncbi:polysaccharide biosynthesis/export family protein [Psychrobacter sp. APC 3426]|uniref:polysaccharide biosynthesis/export family protein n=1 Tax=Psychrobacter sp. APC 3426 TaxID=3035177 RepID=UPI0025B3A237|nr:polysaccharide biosynthesis/export family protein [Psychrobacter sp. APC 3426]MDN3398520.1 polysaccharide biosynthesis/export family protein [Psychrobacter sp. APC 3426]